ncbi:MAG: hypothetical protein IPL39_02300 [Opitutaceae bacterium]|nr:hypothetical protein [Opitutaceae bacterium]
MPRRLLRPVLAALAAILLIATAVAAPKWHTLQAPHCLIVSQLSERDTRAWASEFEQFTAALRSKIQIDERFLPPLTVVLFSGPSTFGPYRAQNAAGKKRELAGFFATRDTWGVIGLPESFSDEATRHVVLHEATHWMTSATRTELPLWLNEGVAEVFSSFQPKKDHGLLGEPIRGHLVSLQNEKWVPLLQLLLTARSDELYTSNQRRSIFYAQSWILTHKLFFENPEAGHAILNKFFAARLLGTDQVSAFEKACGKDLATLERELEGYARDGRFSFTKLALRRNPRSRAPTPPPPRSPSKSPSPASPWAANSTRSPAPISTVPSPSTPPARCHASCSPCSNSNLKTTTRPRPPLAKPSNWVLAMPGCTSPSPTNCGGATTTAAPSTAPPARLPIT